MNKNLRAMLLRTFVLLGVWISLPQFPVYAEVNIAATLDQFFLDPWKTLKKEGVAGSQRIIVLSNLAEASVGGLLKGDLDSARARAYLEKLAALAR
jgi:hypothetical protein